MLARTEWFTYRMAGWGIAPRTWKGWVYVACAVGLLAAMEALPLPNPTKSLLVGILGGTFLLDALVIWVQLGKVHDERARLHQLIIERNCSVTAVLALVGAMGYQVFQHRMAAGNTLPFDPLLLVVAILMALVKLGSTLYLRWKG